MLATAVHIVELVRLGSQIQVLAFTAIDLVPLPIYGYIQDVVAIPAIDDILALFRFHQVIAIRNAV
jgi:hypothetical protein